MPPARNGERRLWKIESRGYPLLSTLNFRLLPSLEGPDQAGVVGVLLANGRASPLEIRHFVEQSCRVFAPTSVFLMIRELFKGRMVLSGVIAAIKRGARGRKPKAPAIW